MFASQNVSRPDLTPVLETISRKYAHKIRSKDFTEENAYSDPLMQMLGITPEEKKDNRQFWGVNLGNMWEEITMTVFREYRADFFPKIINEDKTSPADYGIGKLAVDTKYRVGSGDTKTLKGLRDNGAALKAAGYDPVVLMLRTDSTKKALHYIKDNWTILAGDDSFEFIKELTGFDLKYWMTHFHV